jgi:PAS domain S-box
LNTSDKRNHAITNGTTRTSAEATAYIEELKKVNEELRQARRAALNLMEDAILSRETLRITENRIRIQKEAFQFAINGGSLQDSLNILIRIIKEELGSDVRTAFYLAYPNSNHLHTIKGAGDMPDSYTDQVEAILFTEEEFADGMAFVSGLPVLTPDVFKDPLWKLHAHFAREHNFRSCYSYPILSAEGKPVGTFVMYFTEVHEATFQDFAIADAITQASAIIISRHIISQERIQAESALTKSEERLRILADAVPQVIWTNDSEGKANYFNQRWYNYSGLTCEQSEGLGWQVIVHPDDGPESIKKWNQSLEAGKVFDTEYRLRRSDGSYHWFIGRNIPLKDDSGKVTGWFGSATDIEELKKIQEALRESEERLRITMENATDYAIITMDKERKVEQWSSGAFKIFGFTEAEMLGKSADIIFTEEDRNAGAPQLEMETAKNLGSAADERWHQGKDGNRFYLSGVMRPIYNTDLSGYVKVAREMTKQQLFTEELHRLVGERTLELQRSNDDLRQFAHVASHDLKEPVRKIKTYWNRIIEEYSEELPDQVKRYLGKIEGSINRMYALIEGILRYSKFGNTEYLQEKVDLNQVIKNIESDLEVLIAEKHAQINVGLLQDIYANSFLMYQLFYNLILNSLKFSKEGIPSRIDISSQVIKEQQKSFVKITVSDNGIGFEEEFNEMIFDSFTRLNPADEYEGTGLGLALCKKIVQRHRGSITASGKPDIGATFTILLPIENSNE